LTHGGPRAMQSIDGGSSLSGGSGAGERDGGGGPVPNGAQLHQSTPPASCTGEAGVEAGVADSSGAGAGTGGACAPAMPPSGLEAHGAVGAPDAALPGPASWGVYAV
jgi:hypothetical protein